MIVKDKRIRVLFVLPSLKRAGAETQLVNLVSNMDLSRFELHVFSFEKELDQLDTLKSAGVQHHHYLRQGKYDFSYTKSLAELIDAYKIDIVHCTMQFALLVGWLARWRSKRTPLLVTVIHTTINRSIKEEWQDRLLYRWLLQVCASVIFVCKAQHQYWIDRYPALKSLACTIYNGVDHAHFKPTDKIKQDAASLRARLGIYPEDIVITAVAGFRPEKRHDLLIRAFEKLPINTHMLLAGDGPLRTEIKERVLALGLESRVHFLGTVADIRSVLMASAATVLASTSVETFSMAVLESMSMEVPVIVPDLSGLPEAVVDNKTGFVYSTGSLEELTSAILRMTGFSVLEQKAMGKEARRYLMDNFTEAQMVEQTEDLLQSVLGDIRV